MSYENLVFISYAQEDLEIVWKIYRGLKLRGINVWLDKADLGTGEWKPTIERVILHSRYFIFCVSESSLNKIGLKDQTYVDEELHSAWKIAEIQPKHRFTIVPLRLEDCDRGDPRLSGYQQFDLFHDFEKELDIVALKLGGFALSPDISDYITLDLSGKLISELEKYLTNPTNIQTLNLKETQIRDIQVLSDFYNLEELFINGTRVQDLSPLEHIKHLKKLVVSDTQISDLSPISNLLNLYELDIRYTRITDISPISKLVNIKNLYLGGTKVSDLNPTKRMKNLERLDINQTLIEDFDVLKNFRKLIGLDMSWLKIQNFDFLKYLTNLSRLRFRGIQLASLESITEFKNLSNCLEELDLRNAKIEDIKSITNLKKLLRLDLRKETQVKNNDIIYIQKLMPDLYIMMDR